MGAALAAIQMLNLLDCLSINRGSRFSGDKILKLLHCLSIDRGSRFSGDTNVESTALFKY